MGANANNGFQIHVWFPGITIKPVASAAQWITDKLRVPKATVSFIGLLARLIVVETVRLVRVEPLLPCTFEPDNVAGIHVRRDALKDTELEIPGITFPK